MAPSYQQGRRHDFSNPDIFVFIIILLLGSGVGLSFAIRGRTPATPSKRPWLQTVTSFVSTTVWLFAPVIILGHPSEMYCYNSMFIYVVLGMLLALVGTVWIFIPFFYRLRVPSTMQYLEMRFNYPVRVLGTFFLLAHTVVAMGYLHYGPSIALRAVTGLDIWGCLIVIGILGMGFTVLGTIKLPFWVDVPVIVVLIGGLMAVFIRGSILEDGFANAWNKAFDNGRIEMDNFSFDPTVRHSFWAIVVGGTMMWTTLYAVHQAQVQRYLAAPTVRQAQLILGANGPILALMMILSFLNGLLMAVFYTDCHPISPDLIIRTEQMMHLYIMDLFGHLKGLPGAFVGCFILASLSALTIALNAVATILYKDIYQRSKRRVIVSETTFKRIIIVLADGLSMFMGFVVSTPPALLQTFYTFNSVIAGPFLGVFSLGMFFPWANNLGTFIGAVLAFILNCWIGFGGMINHVATAVKSPVSDLACYYNVEHFRNLTELTNGTTPAYVKMTYPPVETYDGPEQISMLSYMYLAPVGTVVTVIVSLVVSFISGYVRPSSLDPKLICPIFDVVFPFLPECVLRPLRFGIDHKEKYTKNGSSAQPTTVSHTEQSGDISELSGNNITTNGHVNLALEPDDYNSTNGPTHHRPAHHGPTHDGPAHHETNRPFHLNLEAVRLSNGGGKDSQAVFLIENDSRASMAHLNEQLDSRASMAHLNDQLDSRASMAHLNDQLDSRASLAHLNHQSVTKL